MGATSRLLGRPPRVSAVHEPSTEHCRALAQAFRVRRAGIEQWKAPRCKRKSKSIPQTRSSTSSPGHLTEYPRAGEGGSRASVTPNSYKSSEKQARSENGVPAPNFAPNFASILWPACVPPQSSTPLSSGPAPSALLRPPLFTGSFLSVFRGGR